MSKPETDVPAALATTLLANLSAFQAFARRRLQNDELAADAVQESLLRALKAAPAMAHEQNLVAWFYRILRNVLTDLHRKNARESRKLTAYETDLPQDTSDLELESTACTCLRGLLDTLRPEYAEVIRAVDLDGQAQPQVAVSLGVTRDLLKVRLHRARRQLRTRLEQTCTTCATHGCLDCTCEPAQADAPPAQSTSVQRPTSKA